MGPFSLRLAFGFTSVCLVPNDYKQPSAILSRCQSVLVYKTNGATQGHYGQFDSCDRELIEGANDKVMYLK